MKKLQKKIKILSNKQNNKFVLYYDVIINHLKSIENTNL